MVGHAVASCQQDREAGKNSEGKETIAHKGIVLMQKDNLY
jgi:hypothetical protein